MTRSLSELWEIIGMSAYHVSPCMYLVDGCLSARRPGLFDFNRWFGVRVLC
jgi:hypothetical protein